MSTKSSAFSIERLIDNRLFSSAASLAILIAGIVTVSAPLLILAGVLAYGWPFFSIYWLNREETKAERKPARLTALHTNAVAAH